MADFFSRLLADPRKAIDAASITRVDELGNGYDDWNNLIAPKFEQPQQSWGETALGVATAPARLATALAGSVSPYGPDGWQVPPVAQEGWNALTAVGDAYTQGMSEDEMRNRALGMASVMFAGGGPAMALEKSLAPRPVSVRGYHGTRSEFDKFNGPSVFASENPDAASEWAMVANREGGGPNVLPLDITASNPYYAKSLFPDQAERDRIVRADPDVVFYPPSTQHGTTFDTHSGRVFEARKPGTVRSATTGETLFSNASKEGAIPAIASALEQKGARPEPSANALSSELSGTGFYPLSGGAETGTYLAFDDLPGNAPSPKQQQVRTSLFSNSDSRPALLASALGQEQIDPERIKTAIRNRMRGDK